jgi:chromate transporter
VVFRVFLRLGLTAFGGPIAHLGYFHEEFVSRRKWIGERDFADLVALCQFLPGPASSQVGMGIGLLRAGIPGGLAAWLAFTAPSALAMIAFGYGVAAFGQLARQGWLHGLEVVAVAVVAQAVWTMARTTCTDVPRTLIGMIAAVVILLSPTPLAPIGVIVGGGIAGWALLPAMRSVVRPPLAVTRHRRSSAAALVLFFVLLVGLPALTAGYPDRTLALVDSFYRSGSLVFGGGHVILPLLQSEVVPPGWVREDLFLAGYGAAQAVPGPLFTFAAYLGTVMQQPPNGWSAALLCLAAIFLPSFLLVYGALPFWEALRRTQRMQAALSGINAAVTGLLLAALVGTVWTEAIRSSTDFALALVALLMLVIWKLPAWLVVLAAAAAGIGLQLVIRN